MDPRYTFGQLIIWGMFPKFFTQQQANTSFFHVSLYSSQTPYTSPKEAEVYEKSLPSYEQIQMKVVGAAECLGVQSAPVLPVRAGGCTQPVVEAKAEVHRNSEKDGDAHNDEASQEKVTKCYW